MGVKFRVTPEELDKVSQMLTQYSKDYTDIYTQLFQQAGAMGEAWDGADNLAFVDQINGFCEELKAMAQKLAQDAMYLSNQKDNYVKTQENNIAQVRKLAN